MHRRKSIVLFGYGKFGKNIADILHKEDVDIMLVESSEERYKRALREGFETCRLIDVADDRQLERLNVKPHDQLVCVMDDDHLNVFLVLSLKDLFPENKILAISDSIHATSKLKMAGADRVIDLYAVSATRIHNILNKPIATEFLEGFVDDTHEYGFREIEIPEGSFLHGKMYDEVDFRSYGVIFVGMIDVEKGNSFIFVTAGLEHKLDSGDIIVCIGREKDLKNFEDAIGYPTERRKS